MACWPTEINEIGPVVHLQKKNYYEGLVQQYVAVSNLHIKARIHVSLTASGKEASQNYISFYEYWYSNKKYRITSKLSKESPLYEIAVDGNVFQYFDGGTKTLAISTNGAEDGYGSVPFNPLLAPFEFLKPPSGGPEIRQLLMQDLDINSPVHFRFLEYNVLTSEPLVIEFKGGTIENQKFNYRVFFETNGVLIPSVIELISTNGHVIVRSSISYKEIEMPNGSVTLWPLKVVREGFSQHGVRELCAIHQIEKIDFEAIPPNIFVINTNNALQIVNSDTKQAIWKRHASQRSFVRALFFSFLILSLVLIIMMLKSVQNATHSTEKKSG